MTICKGICEAIARVEGFNLSPSNRPTRNNNPGDIEWGKFAQAHGADREEVAAFGRFAHFPDVATGFAALKALLQTPGYKGKTVAETINRYAPPVENNTNNYVALVCQWTGLTPDTVIDDHL